MPTKIEWTDETWNPITGCSHAGSPGCDHCYAKRMAQRLKGRYGYPKDNPFKVTFHPGRLDQPLRWKKPRRIFVVSMGDLFHEDVEWNWQYKIFEIMLINQDHTYLILTKRPEQMKKVLLDIWFHLGRNYPESKPDFPLKNIWLGVTCENQEQADKRIPILLQIPAAVKFVSIEPMLGPIDIVPYIGYLTHECECGFHRDEMHIFPMGSNWLCPECGKMTINREAISWVIVGGESGPGARPMHPDGARSIRDQCQAAGVPFFFKQWGEWCSVIDSGTHHSPFVLKNKKHDFEDGETVFQFGKKKAGRILDGRTWDEYPGRK